MNKIIKLVFSLTAISAVCAAILATVDFATRNQIARIREQTGANAAKAVLPPVKTVEKLPSTDSEYDSYVGKNAEGKAVAYAIVGVDERGYGGRIVLMVGLTPSKQVISFRKLEATETPGLGMNLTMPAFADQFKGMDASKGLKVKKDGGLVQAITSATITSRSVCRAIENACAKLDAFAK